MKKLIILFIIIISLTFIFLFIYKFFFQKTETYNEVKDITITTADGNLDYFIIGKNSLNDEYIESEIFKESVIENIKINQTVDIGFEESIVINKSILSLKYILIDWNIEDNSFKTNNFYYKEEYNTNKIESEFLNSISMDIQASSHYPIFKIYFAEVDNYYIVFPVLAN